MLIALFISLLAGLATSVGGLLATHRKMLDRSVLALSLAFGAGVMLFVSFVEIMPLGLSSLAKSYDLGVANMVLYGAFFAGCLIVALIDVLLPQSINPSEIEGRETKLSRGDQSRNRKLMRSGLLVAVVLALHNFPEGMSTFAASYQDITAGITLALAIAIHNIPEGIAVAAPVYAATKNRKKAFWWATLSGLTEPIGTLVAMILLSSTVPTSLFGAVFGLVAGMMAFVAIDELLPAAQRYQTNKHQSIYGVIAGMFVAALSTILLF